MFGYCSYSGRVTKLLASKDLVWNSVPFVTGFFCNFGDFAVSYPIDFFCMVLGYFGIVGYHNYCLSCFVAFVQKL